MKRGISPTASFMWGAAPPGYPGKPHPPRKSRKGISPIVAVVLLIAIAVVAAVGLYFWAAGLATNQPTPATPIAISATPIKNSAGELGLVIANLGSKDIPAGTTFYTSNGAEANLSSALPAGEQALVTFWGRNDGTNVIDFTNGEKVVYGSSVGSSTIQTSADSPSASGPFDIISDGQDNGESRIAQCGGSYVSVWSSNKSGEYEIYFSKSDDMQHWSAAVNISQNATENDTYPDIACGAGKYVAVYQSSNGSDIDLWVANSTDGVSWTQTLLLGDPTKDDSQPSIVYANGNFTILYSDAVQSCVGDELYNCTLNASNLCTVAPTKAFSASGCGALANGEIGYGSQTGYVASFSEFHRAGGWDGAQCLCLTVIDWSAEMYDGSTKENLYTYDSNGNKNGGGLTGEHTSIIADGSNVVTAFDWRDGKVYVVKGTAGDHSLSSFVANGTEPSLLKDLNGRYWLSYTDNSTGSNRIVVRSSTDPLLW